MTQYYVGVKIVTAWPEERDGKKGYGVKYEDAYISWAPKDVFEKSYMLMGDDPSKVSEEMVDKFMGKAETIQFDDKTSITTARTLTGFKQYEVSSCVDPKNFDITIGHDIGVERIKNVLWECLGFVVQWGRFGLKN